LDGDELVLADEVLTPDSSRFWPADRYKAGKGQPSFDKQYVRDYLESIGWDKQPPVPSLPADIIAGTRDRYRECYRILTGHDLK
jgi:phosphoribosylaminoimidazole-succinocarboxamide synthase